MLRVTRLLNDGVPTLRLEGKLVGPWVDELRAAAEAASQSPSDSPGPADPRLRLDLASVSFIDGAGIDLLEHLMRQGATLAGASSFVVELLHATTPATEGARR